MNNLKFYHIQQKTTGASDRNIVGAYTNLFDCTGEKIQFGNLIKILNTEYCGPIFWFEEIKSYGICFACLYGKDRTNPYNYARAIKIPKDNSMRSCLLNTEEFVR